MSDIYEAPFLRRREANHVPLSPLPFIERTASVFPDRLAVVHGPHRFTWKQTRDRSVCLAGALAKRGIGKGHTVMILAPNIPATLESHFGVPMAGATLCALNTRLDAKTIAFMIEHSEARVLMADRSLADVVKPALEMARPRHPLLVVEIRDMEPATTRSFGVLDYEDLVSEGSPSFSWRLPQDEWQAIALNYTSGTTSSPKGVVYSHRGCALQALDSVLLWGMGPHPVFLWTSPMFHCNGWHFPWTITALAGTHVCLRDVRPAKIFNAIVEERVTHLGGAPTVMGMMVNAPESERRPLPHTVELLTAGAPPAPAVLKATEDLGFNVTQMYGLTETYGQVLVSQWKEEWNTLSDDEKAALKARQGVAVPVGASVFVGDAKTLEPCNHDGQHMGEILIKGNLVMKGYLKNEKATEEAFEGGAFHSGDLAVQHADGYIQIKDRSKDIIISGGENISTVEVEGVLFKHPDVMEAAVVARPDEKWGETPCAFVTLRPESVGKAGPKLEQEIITFAKENMARFKAPKTVVFCELPKTSTGKIQKFVLREKAKQLNEGMHGKAKL